MTAKTSPNTGKTSLEREVILAVTILYALICAVLLAIHYLQPAGQETVTSSTSPSHDAFSTNAAPQALTLDAAYDRLSRDGYSQLQDMRITGTVIEGTAMRDGRPVRFSIDTRTGATTALPIAD